MFPVGVRSPGSGWITAAATTAASTSGTYTGARPRTGLAPVLAESVNPAEPLSEHLHEQRRRKADDVEVVALDRADERGAGPLDCVPACPPLPLARRDVAPELPRRQLAERHLRRYSRDDLPPRRHEA